jgi:hypothetical protein
MRELFDAGWRAAAYCLHWRVVVLSFFPLLLVGGLAFGLSWFYWEPAIDSVRQSLEAWELVNPLFRWLDSIGAAGFRAFLPPLIVVLVATPVIVVLSLLAVQVAMTPAMVSLVAQRRFPALEKRRGGSFIGGVLLGLGTTVLALLALFVTVPLWFIPPLVLVIPPLIWGWLAYRLMSYDVLSDHASKEERRELMRRHRSTLIGMGVLSGYLGTAPSMVWVTGAATLILAPFLMLVAIWIYTLVFVFSGLWFAHYGLAALERLRREQDIVLRDPLPPAPVEPALPATLSSDEAPPASGAAPTAPL